MTRTPAELRQVWVQELRNPDNKKRIGWNSGGRGNSHCPLSLLYYKILKGEEEMPPYSFAYEASLDRYQINEIWAKNDGRRLEPPSSFSEIADLIESWFPIDQQSNSVEAK